MAIVGTMPSALQTPAKFRVMPRIYITLLITAGAPSVVAAESTDGISVVDTAAGRFTVSGLNSASAERCVGADASVEGPASGAGTQAAPTAAFCSLDLAAGTVEVNTYSGATLTDPTTLSKVRLVLELAYG